MRLGWFGVGGVSVMRYVVVVVILALIVSRLVMSGKAEVDLLNAEIAEKNRILEESIGEPRMYQPKIDISSEIVAMESNAFSSP